MPKGYMGKVLWINLTDGGIEKEAIADQVYEQSLSGAGLAASLLYDRVPAGADPLSPDNINGNKRNKSEYPKLIRQHSKDYNTQCRKMCNPSVPVGRKTFSH